MINNTHTYSDLLHSSSRFQTQQSYMDLNSLQNIRKDGLKDQDAALRQVAEQFESMFIQMMLKSMRSANEVFGQDNPLNSFEMKHHQEMYDNQLSLSLSQSNNIGLAESFFRQMKSQYLPNNTSLNGENALAFNGREKTPPIIPQRINDAKLLNGVENPQDFINAMKPYAKKIAQDMGVDYKVLIAQAALETGWGEHVIKDKNGNQSFNLFNIKADSRWQGRSISVPTIEYVDGIAKKETANFRRYNSIADSFEDFQQFLTQPRYKKALASVSDANHFVQELQQAGYATDPQYAKKIQSILNNTAVW